MSLSALDQSHDDMVDSFRELGNIGAGHVASCLSELIHRPCLIDIPRVGALDPAELLESLWNQKTIAVSLRMKIFGDVPSLMCVMTQKDHAQKIVAYMSNNEFPAAADDLPFATQFALKQMGEAITRAFSKAIFEFLSSYADYAMPEIIVDSWSTTVDKLMTPLSIGGGDYLMIHSGFFDNPKTFDGRFLYILEPGAQATVVERFKNILGGAL